MPEGGQNPPRLSDLFTSLKQSLESLNREVQRHCDEDPSLVMTEFENRNLTFQRNVFRFIEGINGVLTYILENVAFKDEVKNVEQTSRSQAVELGDLRRSTSSNLRSIEKDLENDLVSINNLRRSLASVTHNRTLGDGHMERNNHNSFKPKPPNFNNESTESPMNFLNNMQNYLRVVNLDQDELTYTIEACLGKNCKAWFNVIKDRIINWESFAEEFQNMYWNDTIKSEKRRKVEFGKYGKNQKVSRVEYVTNLMSAAKDVVENFNEGDFCISIRAHFERDLRIALRMGRVETLKDVIESLQEFDAGDSKEQNDNSKSTNIYNRHKNFRNGYNNFNRTNFDNDNLGKNNVSFNQNRNNRSNQDNVRQANFNKNSGNKNGNNNVQGNQRPVFSDKNIPSRDNRYNLRSQNKHTVNAIVHDQNQEQDLPDFDAIEPIESDGIDSEPENST